jgi:hypothetical protein
MALCRLRQLDEENWKLKAAMLADLSLDKAMFEDVISESL